MPLDLGPGHSSRDTPALFLETAVSVHDRGEWVGDVDVLAANKQSWHKSGYGVCIHSPAQRADTSMVKYLVSIDTWFELLDPPISHGVVRAQGNWEARLATRALAARLVPSRLILPREPCWACERARLEVIKLERNSTKGQSAESEADEKSDAGAGGVKSLDVPFAEATVEIDESGELYAFDDALLPQPEQFENETEEPMALFIYWQIQLPL